MKRTDKLKKMLEEKGYTKVSVLWENYTMAFEMCGIGGGYRAQTNEERTILLGLSFNEACECIKNMKKIIS